MPKKSDRQGLLRDVPVLFLLSCILSHATNPCTGYDTPIAGSAPLHGSTYDFDVAFIETNNAALGAPYLLATFFIQVLTNRYLRPRLYNIPKRSSPLLYLYSLDEGRFRQEVRLAPAAFHGLVKLLEPHEVFRSRSRNPQGSVEDQLAVFLSKLGRFGNGGSVGILARFFGVSEGSVANFCQRCIVAILSLEKMVVVWPDSGERSATSRRLASRFGFPGCVGFVDGTLFPVYAKPSKDGEDYYTRKGYYGMSGMVVCDDHKRILHIDLGWPGSVHDSRVWSNSALALSPSTYFSGQEYLLADSGYSTSDHILAAFKKVRGIPMTKAQIVFNKRLAQCRYVNEHAIGLLKGRFHSLRGMRYDLSTMAGAMMMVCMIRCATILHNLLLDEDEDQQWESSLLDCDATHSDGDMQPDPHFTSTLRLQLATTFAGQVE
jgi:hypothetical protein